MEKPKNLLAYDGKRISISGKMAFYFFQTFGFPPEIFEEQVNEQLKNSELKRRHIALAVKEYQNGN
jgi:hypothetical protein